MAHPIKVKVTKATPVSAWYKEHIGEEFKVYSNSFSEALDCYMLCKSDFRRMIGVLKNTGDEDAIVGSIEALTIMKSDCEVVKDA